MMRCRKKSLSDDMELPKRKILPEEAVTEEHIRRILRAYRYRLKKIGYNEKITCLFSKQDGENIRFCQADTAARMPRAFLKPGFSKV